MFERIHFLSDRKHFSQASVSCVQLHFMKKILKKKKKNSQNHVTKVADLGFKGGFHSAVLTRKYFFTLNYSNNKV